MGFISLTHLQTALNKIKTMLNNKAELTDIPDKLPADSGNADTVDGKHAVDFLPNKAECVNGANYDDFAVSGFYEVLGDADNPTQNSPTGDETNNNFYLIVQRRSNQYCSQIAVSVRADNSVYIRNKSNDIWGSWTKIMAGNADTVNGHTVNANVPAGAVFTDTKVTNTLAKTTKAYVTGTTSSSTNTGTQVFDTGVYLDTTAGQIVATTFKGALSGNASTATALTSSAGTTHIPVRFSNGKPVAVSEILKYNTGGSLLHGDTRIAYASGYKYALIFAYYNHNLGKTPEYTHPLAIALVGNMSSTTSYNKKPLTEGGPNSLNFTVTNGDIIFNNNGGDNYGYLIIWSN